MEEEGLPVLKGLKAAQKCRVITLANEGIKVLRFGGNDAIPSKEVLRDLQKLVEELEDFYPGIDKWFRRKIVPELKRPSRRFAILLYEGERAIGAAIARRGEKTKLCSLRVREGYQSQGLGSFLMNLIATEIYLDRVKELHFTIPAHMWDGTVGNFLRRYGFKCQGLAKTQYRQRNKRRGELINNNPELACSAPFSTVWHNVEKSSKDFLPINNSNHNRSSIDGLMKY